MNKWIKAVALIAMVALLAGCGQRVEVPAANIGKIMTPNGYQEKVIPTSTFRLNFCAFPGQVCDRLVLADVSDQSVAEDFDLFMPKDRLNMSFRLGMTLGVNRNSVEDLFNKIPPTELDGRIYTIPVNRAYSTYVQRIVRAEARSFLTQFSIDEISNNRDVVGQQLFAHLKEIVDEQTPFTLRYAGLDAVDYPDVIQNAQKLAAERRETIAQEEAQLEVARVQLQRELEEQQLQRRVDVEKADAEAEVNRILAESMTPEYERYRLLQSLDRLAASDNKAFIPMEMLSSMAGQVALGNQASR